MKNLFKGYQKKYIIKLFYILINIAQCQIKRDQGIAKK